jgi:Ca-activated chloride channel family protein
MAEFPYAVGQTVNFIQMMKVEIDEQLMKSIAKKTDGRYFRATSNNKLAEIYGEINKLETTEIEELKFYDYDEKYRPFVLQVLIVSRDWFEEYDLQKLYIKVLQAC